MYYVYIRFQLCVCVRSKYASIGAYTYLPFATTSLNICTFALRIGTVDGFAICRRCSIFAQLHSIASRAENRWCKYGNYRQTQESTE